MKRKVIVLLTAVLCLAAPLACGSAVDKEELVAQVVEEYTQCGSSDTECQSFQLVELEPLQLSSADQANGLERAYCVRLSFMQRTDHNGEWWDKQVLTSVGITQDGQYEWKQTLYHNTMDTCQGVITWTGREW